MSGDTNLWGEELPRLGAPLFAERWSNKRAFDIGVMTGRGLTAQRICDRLGDGVMPNMITGMWSFWGYHTNTSHHTYAAVPVPLSGIHRTMIDAEAERRRMDIQDICQAVMENVARDALWSAVLDA
jgi:hypothetical protein